jgi:3-deoxy-D-manno-octulosonic-acid transferase
VFHFEEIAAMALERGAARQVLDMPGLAAAVALYLDEPELRRRAGRAATTLVTENRGALGRTLNFMVEALRERAEPASVRGTAASAAPDARR